MRRHIAQPLDSPRACRLDMARPVRRSIRPVDGLVDDGLLLLLQQRYQLLFGADVAVNLPLLT